MTPPDAPAGWFCALLDAAADVYFRYSLRHPRGFVYVSPSVQALAGCSPDELYRNPDRCLGLIPSHERMVSNIDGTQEYGVFTSMNIITIETYDAETVTGSGWGYHVGGDVAYFFSRHVGLGGVLRFNGGSVTVREPLSEISVKLKMGGPMFGAGVRFRF